MPMLLASYPQSPAAETWEFDTIANCTTVGVPISTANAYTGMSIDWGDGNVTAVESVSDYVHTYEEAGQYHITVSYNNWADVELSYSSSTSAASPIAEARTSIAKVYKIPKVANTSFEYLFYRYTALEEVAADTFAENTQVTTFAYTFYYCTSLTSIPSGLFDNNTAVTDFGDTFIYCTSLTAIPEGLFDNNTAVTHLSSTFMYCSGLTAIPSGLFDNNTAVSTFDNTFFYCTSLTAIPSGLFRYNTAVVTFVCTFYRCSGLTNQSVYIGSETVRTATHFMNNTGSGNTVYVPEGSTTETTFNSASNIGCTVATY